ncbi:hypothetical protein TNCV_1975241 [Trichonephila clavipes]|nr:hypothetical protein TNCV_1975241 [Trichonephila clavipes]
MLSKPSIWASSAKEWGQIEEHTPPGCQNRLSNTSVRGHIVYEGPNIKRDCPISYYPALMPSDHWYGDKENRKKEERKKKRKKIGVIEKDLQSASGVGLSSKMTDAFDFE